MGIIYEQENKTRLDKFLATYHTELSRAYIQKIIKEDMVKVNGKIVKSNYKLTTNDIIDIEEIKPKDIEILAQNIPIEIVYEDQDVLIINKAAGMVVHPAPGNYDNTLVNAIMYHCKDRLSTINGVIRPGIVHRIDKDTSGLLVICKNDKSHNSIASQLKEHSVHRRYIAICYNNIKTDEGKINEPIGRSTKNRLMMAINYKKGKEAITNYEVIERLDSNKYTYLKLKLETGRTHQIRVHLANQGNPLVGDPIYGPKRGAFGATGQMLHAKELGFIHPSTGKYVEFSVEPPEKFQHILNVLKAR